jgi:CRP/FNR family transcriptional regulator, polysaccharide utilization system transcription regulator
MKSETINYLFNYHNNPNNILGLLTESERSILEKNSITKTVKKGGLIFKEGTEPQGLIVLTKGSAKVYKVGVGDREQIVRLVKPMSFVGYKALFAEKKHVASAEAIEESEIVIYDKESLFHIVDRNPLFSRGIIKALANELGFNFDRIINLTQKHIRGRLAETLLLIKDIHGLCTDGRTLNAHFTRENLAHFSNMTTSNAIRTLKKFNDEQIIRIEGKKIILLDIAMLEKISNLG